MDGDAAALSYTAHAGCIRLRGIAPDTCDAIVERAGALDWARAKVAQRYDGFRVREVVADEYRDAMSLGPVQASGLMTDIVGAVDPACRDAVQSHWRLGVGGISSPQFTRYELGHFIKSHRDSGEAFPDRLFTVVCYLTDDYDGGEIVFPATGLRMKPDKGDVLIFPSDMVHEVNPVRSGKKLVFLFFYDR